MATAHDASPPSQQATPHHPPKPPSEPSHESRLDSPYQPKWYFFYGSLRDPHTLNDFLQLPPPPQPLLRRCSLHGFAVGYAESDTGLFPALISGDPTHIVDGCAYLVTTQEHERILSQQEPRMYKLAPCSISFSDGLDPATAAGVAFLYDGDPSLLTLPKVYQASSEQGARELNNKQRHDQIQADRAESVRRGEGKPSYLLASLEASGLTMDQVGIYVDLGPEEPWKPVWYFFYGTLTQPEVLKDVLDLPPGEEPLYQPAVVVGYALAERTPYRALIDGDSGQLVTGLAYLVQKEEHEKMLAEYETDAYEVHECFIQLPDCKETPKVSGKTFLFAGDMSELKQDLLDGVTWERKSGAA
ncbi:uncharacterized protein B0I36DRAFT_319551 [Microdochium trichocladiopsis]|uniref:Putative gamma-glutamylcyclotransferase n=1 Tax=Microdochium trichocladiopsis TaxID=1682393 RepID=A0A9P8YDR2_9PEZI|nr:uncharacterized protein B0I36DRAFT_319551 [Microdochium trichocladiopsis]KAH7036025.1 hypothetical protein B0I36DRAFT_319551 [Microdochium trichocladiopsis]